MFTKEDYNAAILQAARISERLTRKLDEEGQDLFEEYCELYAKMLDYERTQKLHLKR